GAATRVRRRAATAATAATAAARRQHRRDERPLHAVNAARRGALRRAQGAPDWIDDRYGDVARDRRLEVIADRRAARRVFANEALVAADIGIGAIVEQVGDGPPNGEQRDILRRDGRRELLERSDVVGNPETAAVRRRSGRRRAGG